MFLSCLSNGSPPPPPATPRRTEERSGKTSAGPADRTPFQRRLPPPSRITRSAVIKRGDRGADVMLVQNAIHRLIAGRAPLLSPDGTFGLMTEAAVRRIQHDGSLHADGVVGVHTKRVLDLI
ncbi:MAG: peptidoglycan-binding domain-containing protein [Janthinobacterium lividum]